MKRSALLALFVVMLAFPASAAADANLVRSNPAPGQVLDQAPSEMVLEFSEDLDPVNTHVELYNSRNQSLNLGPGRIDPNNPRILRLTLGDLPKDSYTAAWRARSATDGHFTEGNIPFGIGIAPAGSSLVPAAGSDPALQQPPIFETFARGINLCMAALAFGSLPFALFVLQPTPNLINTSPSRQTSGKAKKRQTPAAIDHLIRRLTLIGCVSFLVSNILFLSAEAYNLAGSHLIHELGVAFTQLLSVYSGFVWIARMLLTIVIATIVWRRPEALQNKRSLWLLLALAAATLLTFSLTAHGAALDHAAPLAVAIDWLHIAATITWLGGLAPLLGAIHLMRTKRAQGMQLQTIMPRFSTMALIAVGTLALSGLYSFLIHVQELDLLAATTFGRAILLKTTLFAILFALGAINLRIFSPQLKKLKNSMAASFARTVPIEIVLGALLLLTVGALTSVATSQSAWTAHELIWANFLSAQARVDGVGLTLYVSPGKVGTNEFVVDVTDDRRSAETVPGEVVLRITKPGDKLGTLQVETTSGDGLRFLASGSYISLPGAWQIEVILRRKGFNDARTTFEFEVSE